MRANVFMTFMMTGGCDSQPPNRRVRAKKSRKTSPQFRTFNRVMCNRRLRVRGRLHGPEEEEERQPAPSVDLQHPQRLRRFRDHSRLADRLHEQARVLERAHVRLE